MLASSEGGLKANPVRAMPHLVRESCRVVTFAGFELCGKNGVSMGTSRSTTPVKLQYEPRVDIILQHGYSIYAAKYGKLARLVPSKITFFPQNRKSILLANPVIDLSCQTLCTSAQTGKKG